MSAPVPSFARFHPALDLMRSISSLLCCLFLREKWLVHETLWDALKEVELGQWDSFRSHFSSIIFDVSSIFQAVQSRRLSADPKIVQTGCA